jgi:hypothetical protein
MGSLIRTPQSDLPPGGEMQARPSIRALFVLSLLPSTLVVAPAVADHTPEPTSVAIPGSFNDELGCPGDWQPECDQIELTANADEVWRGLFPIPAGAWEYKAALNDTWDENYPILAGSADQVVQTAGFDAATGSFSVPARTTAVFIDQEPDVTPPTATAELILVGGNGIGRSEFQVVASCEDDRDPDPSTTATINGVPVEDGQVVVFVPSNRERWQYRDGVLFLYAKRFTLEVTCTDAPGNVGTATYVVRLGQRPG